MVDVTGIIAIISVFGSLTAICVLPSYLKYRSHREMQTTVRAAIAEGQVIPPEMIDVMTRDVKKGLPSRSRDMRRGVLWFAVGVALALVGVFNDLEIGDARWDGMGTVGAAVIPIMVGLAYLLLSRLNKVQD